MKLSEEHHSGNKPSLGDDASAKEPFLKRIVRKCWEFVTSAKGITLFWALVTFVGASFLLSTDYLALSKIAENDISTQDVYAPFDMDVEDEGETSLKRKQAAQDVLPVFEPVQEKNSSVRESLNRLFHDVEALGLDDEDSLEQKQAAFIALVGNQPGAGKVFQRLFSSYSSSRLERLRYMTQVTTDRVLKEGLSPTDYVENRDEIIRKFLPEKGASVEDLEIAHFLTSSVLRPNRIIDQKAWQKAQDSAMLRVKPEFRFFRKGQKIIGKGEVLTPLKIKALETMGKSVKGINWIACVGVLIITALFTATLWGYLFNYEGRQFFKPTYAALVATLTLCLLGVIKLSVQSGFPLVAVPMATFALLVAIFTHPRIGVLCTTLIVFLIAIAMKLDFSILTVLLFSSVVGVFVLSRRFNFSDRSQLMYAGVYVGLANGVMLGVLYLLGGAPHLGHQWHEVMMTMFWGVIVSGLGSGILTLGILPLLESVFRLVTPFTLMELGNHDQPLLKRMQFEAPGTFHHSIMVSTLCEAAAEAIGANPLLAKVGAIYHDIGKMKRPLFFIENQAYFGVENPHDRLTPRLSKMVVTAHPRDSVEMAKQYRLPEVLSKFMKEHHGTLVAGYFYNQACQEEGEENVSKSQFRYPGPKPDIKETAICMLCDACESAVRALKAPTPAQIEERVEKIINQRVEDGQFDNCPITMRDITVIKETIVRVLRGIQHNRIEYQQNVMRELGRKISLPDPVASQAGGGKASTSAAEGGGSAEKIEKTDSTSSSIPPESDSCC